MKILDLSHKLDLNMSLYSNQDGPEISKVNLIAESGFDQSVLRFKSHIGTHMDAPGHIIAGGAYLDQLPIDRFVGSAFKLNILTQGLIGREELLNYKDQIQAADYLILNTGYWKHWGSENYKKNYPVLTQEAANFLCELGLVGIGIDTISVDEIESNEFPIHRVLLSAGILIVENLNNLDELPEKSKFIGLPLNYEYSDGCPIRAIAMF